jgi:hypothetical protein
MRSWFGAKGGAILLGVILAACAAPAEGTAGDDLSTFVVANGALPEAATRTFFDFGGKVHLVGYEFSPEGAVQPGGTLQAKLYWRRVGALEPDWSLFTHVDDERGRQLRNYDKVGPFRGALGSKPEGLARLALGKVYVDEQTIEIPRGREVTPKVVFVVGVWHDQVRLPVVSGVANGKHAAAVATFGTGVQRQAASPPAAPVNEPKR